MLSSIHVGPVLGRLRSILAFIGLENGRPTYGRPARDVPLIRFLMEIAVVSTVCHCGWRSVYEIEFVRRNT